MIQISPLSRLYSLYIPQFLYIYHQSSKPHSLLSNTFFNRGYHGITCQLTRLERDTMFYSHESVYLSAVRFLT